jgi:hypothetical protein
MTSIELKMIIVKHYNTALYKALHLFLCCSVLACSCPPDVKLGDVKMKKPNFCPLRGGETLQYINSKNKVMTFTYSPPYTPATNKILVGVLCKKEPVAIQFAYYEGTPSMSLHYSTKDDSIQIYHSFMTLNDQTYSDTLFYDMVISQVNNKIGEPISIDIMTSNRGNYKKFSIVIIDRFKNIKMVKDTMINNNRYSNLYFDQIRKNALYAENIGLVAFFYKNEWWYLNN